jgi:hypothetical protein
MPTIYARVSDGAYAYVKRNSEDSGLSLAATVDALLSWCSQQGIGVEGKVGYIISEPAHE